MRMHLMTALVLASSCSAAFAQTQALRDSTPATVGGVEAVCTGASAEARANPKWRAYPVRLEFSGARGQFLGDETVTVKGNGIDVSVSCQGPWLLLKLPAGRYDVSADVADAGHKDIELRAPARIAVSFPMAGGKATTRAPAPRRELAATRDLNRKTLQVPNPVVHHPELKDEYSALDRQYRAQISATETLRQTYSGQRDTHDALNRELQDWSPAKDQQFQNQKNAYLLKETPYEEQARQHQQQHADYQARLTRYETELRTAK